MLRYVLINYFGKLAAGGLRKKIRAYKNLVHGTN